MATKADFTAPPNTDTGFEPPKTVDVPNTLGVEVRLPNAEVAGVAGGFVLAGAKLPNAVTGLADCSKDEGPFVPLVPPNAGGFTGTGIGGIPDSLNGWLSA